MGTINRFEKDPDALLDFQVDWAAWLSEGDTIASSTWDVPDGLVEESSSATTTTATVWLSGGTAGSTYKIANRITTTDGRIDDRTLYIMVEET